MRKNRSMLRAALLSLALFAVVIGLLVYTLTAAGRGAQSEQIAATRQAVQRAVASCYAIEGFYPPDLSYLQEHYGLQIDESRFVVHYTSIGSNLMPDIDVIPISS